MKLYISKITFPVLLIALLAETFWLWLGPRLIVDTAHPYLRTKISALKLPEIQSDVLILGDSVPLQAIDTVLLQQELDMPCFNLALVGRASMAGNYFILKRYLKHHPKPKALIIMNLYNTWVRDFHWEHHRVGEFVMNHFAWEVWRDLPSRGLSWKEIYETFQAGILNALPSLRYKYEIQKLETFRQFIDALSGKSQETMKAEILKNRGTRFVRPKPDQERNQIVRKDLEKNLSFVRTHDFMISKMNQYYFFRLLDWSKEQEVPILFILPPVLDEFLEDPRAKHYLEQAKAFLLQTSESYPLLSLPFPDNDPVFVEELTDSVEHITPKKAGEFTKKLAAAIQPISV